MTSSLTLPIIENMLNNAYRNQFSDENLDNVIQTYFNIIHLVLSHWDQLDSYDIKSHIVKAYFGLVQLFQSRNNYNRAYYMMEKATNYLKLVEQRDPDDKWRQYMSALGQRSENYNQEEEIRYHQEQIAKIRKNSGL